MCVCLSQIKFLCFCCSPDVTFSPPSSAMAVAPEQLSSDPLSTEPLSTESLGTEPLCTESQGTEPLTDGSEVKFTECKVTSESGDEELVIAIADVPLVDSGSSDNDTTQWEDIVSAGPPGGSTTQPGRKTVKRKCSPRKCKSDSGTWTDEKRGTGRRRVKIEGEEDVENTVRTRNRGRPRKGQLLFQCICCDYSNGSGVELGTLDYESPGLNPVLRCVKTLGRFFHSTLLQFT